MKEYTVKRICKKIIFVVHLKFVGLDTEEDFDRHFPVEVTTQDFVYNWSLRDERSKVNEVRGKFGPLMLIEN